MVRWCVMLVCALQLCRARIFDKCEVAQQLRRHGVREQDLPDWLCLAYQESRYDSGAMGRLNADGSKDHGLFQISDLYWCDYSSSEPYRFYRNLCRASCDDFRDDDISDDMACVMKIHQEHTRLQGNGFMAWVAWRDHCRGASMAAYSPDHCGGRLTTTTPPPRFVSSTRRPKVTVTGRPDALDADFELAPLMPKEMTNGHVRRPQANVLIRTSQHNKSRLKPYTKVRHGWQPPKTPVNRPAATWSPSERTTTPAPSRWSTTKSPWQRHTTRRPVTFGSTTRSPWQRRTTRRPVTSSWRPWQPRLTTVRPWQRQQNSFSRSTQGTPDGANPYSGNVFLPKGSTQRPRPNPFTHNVFLSGSSSQGSRVKNPFGGNVFLSQPESSVPRATTTPSPEIIELDLPPVGDSFQHNVFLAETGGGTSSSTPQSHEEFQMNLPPILGSFGHNAFLKHTVPTILGTTRRPRRPTTSRPTPRKTSQTSAPPQSLEEFQLNLPPVSGSFGQNVFLKDISPREPGAGQIEASQPTRVASEGSALNLPPIARPFDNIFLSKLGPDRSQAKTQSNLRKSPSRQQPAGKTGAPVPTTRSPSTRPARTQIPRTSRPRPYNRRKYQTIDRSRSSAVTSTTRPSSTTLQSKPTEPDVIAKLTTQRPRTTRRPTTRRPSFTQKPRTKRPTTARTTRRPTTKRPTFTQKPRTKRPTTARTTRRPTTKRPTFTQKPRTKRPTTTRRPTTRRPIFTQKPRTKRPTTTRRPTTRRPIFTQKPRTKRPTTTRQPTTRRFIFTQKPRTKRPTTTRRPTTRRPNFTRKPRTKRPTTARTTRRPTTKRPTFTQKPRTKRPTTTRRPTTRRPIFTQKPRTKLPKEVQTSSTQRPKVQQQSTRQPTAANGGSSSTPRSRLRPRQRTNSFGTSQGPTVKSTTKRPRGKSYGFSFGG